MRIKVRSVVLGLVLALFASMASAAAAPVAGSGDLQSVSVQADVERPREVQKVIDFTKKDEIQALRELQRHSLRPSLFYCTPKNNNPAGCLRYEPTMSWTVEDCDGEVFVLDITYVNQSRREVPVETTTGDFTDTMLVPAAVPAGPGVYFLQFRLSPASLQLITGHWPQVVGGESEDVIFSRLSLRNETTPLC